MPIALEHIRRMRGGAQSHLLRCSDGGYYVVKFQNNPQHPRVLVNELLGTRLAARMGLPTPPAGVIEVRKELIENTAELVVQTGTGRIPCAPGFQFGSRFPGDPATQPVHDFLPDELLGQVANLSDFAGMLVFDKWTCNTNGRQAIFTSTKFVSASSTQGMGNRGEGRGKDEIQNSKFAPTKIASQASETHRSPLATRHSAASGPDSRLPTPDSRSSRSPGYSAWMIDQGFCFNAGEWNFPDAPLRGIYARNRVYESVRGMETFQPWLERVEKAISESVLDSLAAEIPPEWYGCDTGALGRLFEQLLRRRRRLPDLLREAKDTYRRPFVNWGGNDA